MAEETPRVGGIRADAWERHAKEADGEVERLTGDWFKEHDLRAAAEAEVSRLRDEVVRTVRERDALRAQVEPFASALAQMAENLAALSSSEPVTAGPEFEGELILELDPCIPTLGHSCGHCHRCTPPAGEVAPPAEQRAERHRHCRLPMECVHNGLDCCSECCERGGVFEARP